MPSKKELGARIKSCRLEQNLTLKEVEVKANVSATHVSEIERGMTSPTVGAMTKIARALNTEPSYFLQHNAYPAVCIVRAADRPSFRYEKWAARIDRLSTGIHPAEMSFLELDVDAGGDTTPEAMRHTGEALAHILKGVVEITVGTTRHLLKEGDSLHFRAREPHTVRNIGDGAARIAWATSPPLFL